MMNKKKTGQKYSNCKVIFIVRYLLVTIDSIEKSKRQTSIIFSLFRMVMRMSLWASV
jgi:hypothetical protein